MKALFAVSKKTPSSTLKQYQNPEVPEVYQNSRSVSQKHCLQIFD